MKPQFLLSLLLALLLAISVPLAAQDEVDTDDLTDEDAIILVGEIHFTEDGDIEMTTTDEETGETETFVIAPAGAFNPSTVEDGDVVIIVGRLLPDGMTVQAAEFEFFVEDEEEAEEMPEATPEVTEEAPVEEEETEEEPVATCGNSNHPVANRLAAEFEMSVDEIMAMHCAGNGFGNIARALLLAQNDENGATAQDFLDRHHNGEGWGHIVRESGMHPSELAPGQIGKNKHGDDTDDGETETTTATQRGNGNNGNGHGNGNNGNNGNGRGNGGNKGGKNK